MADTTANQQNGGNDFTAILGDATSLGQVAITGYFSEQTAKAALNANPVNTGLVIGGIVIIGVLLFFTFKK